MARAILAGKRLGWRLGKVEEELGKVLAQGIEAWWPEEGDRGRGDDRTSSARLWLNGEERELSERKIKTVRG